MENYKNNVEFIKNEFGKYFVKISHEDNILQGTKYAGSHTNCRSCLYTITKMLKELEKHNYRVEKISNLPFQKYARFRGHILANKQPRHFYAYKILNKENIGFLFNI